MVSRGLRDGFKGVVRWFQGFQDALNAKPKTILRLMHDSVIFLAHLGDRRTGGENFRENARTPDSVVLCSYTRFL